MPPVVHTVSVTVPEYPVSHVTPSLVKADVDKLPVADEKSYPVSLGSVQSCSHTSPLRVYPLSQAVHFSAPLVVQSAPVASVPLVQVHTLTSHIPGGVFFEISIQPYI